jgi:biopolymer transport protein ExbD
MKKRRFAVQGKLPEDMPLQITSMADIFTILLVFLLKSYAVGAVNVSPTQGVTLPVAKGGQDKVEALKLEVSENIVTVEGKPVANLLNYRFGKEDVLGNGTSKALQRAISQERARQTMIAKSNSDVKTDAKIMIMADQKVPYTTLKTVLSSAAVHGYTDFKLVVVQDN